MPRSPDKSSNPESIVARSRSILRKLFGNNEKYVEPGALDNPWDDDMCLALKTEIESKPEGLNVDKIVDEAYVKLTSLLGPHSREGVTKETIKDRIIFTDPETLKAFRYIFEQPGENSDKYWDNPIQRVNHVRGIEETISIFSTQAVCFGNLGLIMVPNKVLTFEDLEVEDVKHLDTHKVGKNMFQELQYKRLIAHEMTHFLYSKLLLPHYPLDEQITDYMATKAFPEIQWIDVRLAWAKVATEEYIKLIGGSSVTDLANPTLTQTPRNETSTFINPFQNSF